MLLYAAPPPPVSYGTQVAAIFALYCNVCHGDSGGLSTRSYGELMAGGNLGKVVVPGDPERSLLLHFVDGRRGEAHRMPLGGRPLSPEQRETIRRWIAEGAKDDGRTLPTRTFRLAGSEVDAKRILRIRCRMEASSYVRLTLRSPEDGRILLSEAVSVKTPKEHYDAGVPGEPIHWDVRAGPNWPGTIDIELTVESPGGDPGEAYLSAAFLP